MTARLKRSTRPVSLLLGGTFATLAALVMLTTIGWSQPAQAEMLPEVDLVRVIKNERRLFLLNGDRIVREYEISLGGDPEGHKFMSGDHRTPEGVYTLDTRNPNSNFYRSIRISYPNEQDVARAEAEGLDPGGNIMIHGLPNSVETEQQRLNFEGQDWTEGCVAVNDNAAMDEIWKLVRDGTLIEILP